MTTSAVMVAERQEEKVIAMGEELAWVTKHKKVRAGYVHSSPQGIWFEPCGLGGIVSSDANTEILHRPDGDRCSRRIGPARSGARVPTRPRRSALTPI